MATTIARTCLNITRVLTLPVLLATNNIYIFIYIYTYMCVWCVCANGRYILEISTLSFPFFLLSSFLGLDLF